ncbi:MAG: dihydrolipoyl dehydrogenase [Pelagibacterales bacterium]|nr:dihydrolipoyl dehydrogenase [Pelagibacterales bacterium]PPR16894.1 MAG: Dihydrolipoyl dehydrogenase 3 [Alphaproteobacteria bacterium MarineAlpha9_Bin3]|tara:strand:- start:15611 stop:17002 length:1392 start_codon:yes stop_codon:yes gene_type:complete
MEKFDLLVIGGGPGGYVAAISAAQNGLKVACIDKRKSLGGTCLNVGCIPSKRLLHSSKLYKEIINDSIQHGIQIKKPTFNLFKMMEGKKNTVEKLTKGIEHLFKKNNIKHIIGHASFDNDKIVKVDDNKFSAENIIIATGSIPSELKNIKIDEKYIVSSTGALNFEKVPKKLAIIGAGYIGLELGSVWSRLGSEVIVIEYGNSIVPSMDVDISNNFFKELQKQGINFMLESEVISANVSKNKVLLNIKSMENNLEDKIIFDKALLAVGRTPTTNGLGLDNLNISVNSKGYIEVNQFYETSCKGIYAIGDVIEGPMLAHKASVEAEAVVDIIIGRNGQVNYNAIPAVVYTSPEVAWVGKTKQELDKYNINYKEGKFLFSANSRSKVTGNSSGMVKVYSHIDSNKILGAHIMGEHAGELIGEFVVSIEMGATAEDIALICHAHPTLSESMKEAASIASYGKTIHS